MTVAAPPSIIDLTGEVALVTGASSGLGRHFALTLAAHGATVVAAGRRRDRLADVVAQIVDAGGAATAVPIDVTDHESMLTGFSTIADQVGDPTILVNNAGIPDAQRATKMPVELIDQVIATNLRGPYIMACEFARRLMAQKRGGRIVNISSMAAFDYGGDGAALYSITKAAVNRMTEALAVEWAKFDINVNAIAPGVFASEMTDGMLKRIADPRGTFPRQRIGDADQLESTLLYLVSPASGFVTGTVIKVDDGQLRR
ncbi:SDR family NAD(P)-dependent oxidoreductase [Aeromicrobium yanjiei]|uniref:SDR family oxidoreductase n=1 Tax=Aeromicrobium yanjiei TaxID=2662028 RepID=A0A5Q2MFZ3_9ACTN|nr:SDR family NAD(P)-dependent oxidoreductase [Aeromicrobium yanjiei]QGG41558.1 SDR family oxidoreductase [Aeromicrobium yanjiei]